MPSFSARVPFGRTGITTSPLGLSSGYGIGESDVRRAFEAGVRFFYFGSRRTSGFARGIASLGSRRDEATVVVQSYTRVAWMMRGSVERALRSMKTDRADVLLLGWWNQLPPERILDAAAAIKAAGLARTVLISSHDRPLLAQLANDPRIDAVMVRYNAAHPGAERELFPHLGEGAARRVGVVAYTATRWGMLLDPRKTPPGEATPRASDCYRFALSNPAVDVCATGPRDAAELDEALLTLERGPLSAGEIAWMKRVGVAVRDASQGDVKRRGMDFLDRLCAT